MKILIVNFSDTDGGAARAANRLYNILLKQNIDAKMFVNIKESDDYRILSPKSNWSKILVKIQALVNVLPLKYYKKKAPFSTSFSPSFGFAKKINNLKPDVVHLHWINAGMIKIEELSEIKAPIIWSLHDMWPFTGGCHYSDNCQLFQKKCGTCHVLNSSKRNDISNKILFRKIRTFSKIPNLTIVGLSNWLTGEAKKSTLFKNCNVINLPNPINTEVFDSFDKTSAKKLWNLSNDKKYILFGSVKDTSDIRKGYSELKEALEKLNLKNVELLIFGSSKPKDNNDFKFKATYLGKLNDDVSLRILYNLAEVMVVPSLQENLSNIIMESLSCTTPVVAFNIGGNSDLIDHKKNGYLAKANDSLDLANGISWVLEHKNIQEVKTLARKKVLDNFEENLVAEKYINLYKSTLQLNKN